MQIWGYLLLIDEIIGIAIWHISSKRNTSLLLNTLMQKISVFERTMPISSVNMNETKIVKAFISLTITKLNCTTGTVIIGRSN